MSDFRELLAEGLDLCVRARQMDAMDRREAVLSQSTSAEEWQASGRFDRFVERNNIEHPHKPIATKSGTVHLWLTDQYDKDLADWEKRARTALLNDPALPAKAAGIPVREG